MTVEVLRLSHRLPRDQRISTHIGLVSRAFGASAVFYSGMKDSSMEDSIKKIVAKFGGPFSIEHIKEEIKLIKEKKSEGFKIVHLTMYGQLVQNKINIIKRNRKLLVIVGGEKVEGEIYKIADFNVAVTSQPHSEVAALSIFLDKYFESKELDFAFADAKIRVVPQDRGKLLKNI